MKITQNPENGQILLHLKQGEKYDIEDHLAALTKFLTEQAQTVFNLKRSYKKILEQLARVEQLEDEFNEHIRNS